MPYVERDTTGRISHVSAQPTARALEFLDSDHPEVRQFVLQSVRSNELLDSLRETDSDFVRVVEDLIHILTAKGLIRHEELPEAVRRKLDARASLRRQYRDAPLLKFDDDVI